MSSLTVSHVINSIGDDVVVVEGFQGVFRTFIALSTIA